MKALILRSQMRILKSYSKCMRVLFSIVISLCRRCRVLINEERIKIIASTNYAFAARSRKAISMNINWPNLSQTHFSSSTIKSQIILQHTLIISQQNLHCKFNFITKIFIPLETRLFSCPASFAIFKLRKILSHNAYDNVYISCRFCICSNMKTKMYLFQKIICKLKIICR